MPVPVDGLTVSVSGANATLFSLISPKSKTSVGFLRVLFGPAFTSTKNSRFSMRERSEPLGLSTVRIERQRRPAGVTPTMLFAPTVQAKRYFPVDGT